MIIDSGDKPHTCGTCEKTIYPEKPSYTAYAQNHMNVELVENHLHGKVFSQIISSFTREINYIAVFTQEGLLLQHMFINSRNKPHARGTSGKSVSWKCRLTDHMHIHLEDKHLNVNFVESHLL